MRPKEAPADEAALKNAVAQMMDRRESLAADHASAMADVATAEERFVADEIHAEDLATVQGKATALQAALVGLDARLAPLQAQLAERRRAERAAADKQARHARMKELAAAAIVGLERMIAAREEGIRALDTSLRQYWLARRAVHNAQTELLDLLQTHRRPQDQRIDPVAARHEVYQLENDGVDFTASFTDVGGGSPSLALVRAMGAVHELHLRQPDGIAVLEASRMFDDVAGQTVAFKPNMGAVA